MERRSSNESMYLGRDGPEFGTLWNTIEMFFIIQLMFPSCIIPCLFSPKPVNSFPILQNNHCSFLSLSPSLSYTHTHTYFLSYTSTCTHTHAQVYWEFDFLSYEQIKCCFLTWFTTQESKKQLLLIPLDI